MMNRYPPLREQNCGNCRYFRGGQCRRHAPRPEHREHWQRWDWPKTYIDVWCGEWAPQEAGQ
jgi:hypothetical protein